MNDHICWEESPSHLEASIALPEDSLLCIVTPTESLLCEQDDRFESGLDDSSDFFRLNSRGDMIIPLHLSCLRIVEQVDQYRRLQGHCASVSPGSVELIYKALCRQKRCKAYLFRPPYTRVYMTDGDHDFHGISSDPHKDISWISIGTESVSNLICYLLQLPCFSCGLTHSLNQVASSRSFQRTITDDNLPALLPPSSNE